MRNIYERVMDDMSTCARRRLQPINIDENDIIRLQLLANSMFANKTLAQRARIILLCSEGHENKMVAEMLNIRPNTVSDVRKRFEAEGIDGLYDKNRVGRRGGQAESPDKAVLDYYHEHEGEEMNIQGISEALNIPSYTVRRVLQSNCIQLQRTNVWNIATQDSIIGRYLQFGGVYISGATLAVIIRAFESGNDGTGTHNGMVITRDRLQAKSLDNHTRNSGPVSLAEALAVASQTGHSNARVIPFASFMAQMVEDDTEEYIDTHEYHVILFQQGELSGFSKEIMKKRIVIHETDTVDAWHTYVSKVLEILEPVDGFSSSTKLLSSLDSYLNKHQDIPFVWRLIPDKPSEKETATIDPGSEHSVHIDQTVEIHDGEAIIWMSGVLLNCSDGKVTQTVVSRMAPVPAPEDFDFSSIEGYSSTVTAFDTAITNTSTEVNQELMGMCLNSHVKKNGR